MLAAIAFQDTHRAIIYVELCTFQMFETLYPQALVSKHYGISVYWEVQIIHDELVDTEIPVAGIDRAWPFEYFFREDKVES